MNRTKEAKDLNAGDVVLVSYVNPRAKHPIDRLVVQFDPNGFPSTVTQVRAKALVGRGMMVELSQGAFRRVTPDMVAPLATN